MKKIEAYTINELIEYCKKSKCKECDFFVSKKNIKSMCKIIHLLTDNVCEIMLPCDWSDKQNEND
jgi:hypothetical protein